MKSLLKMRGICKAYNVPVLQDFDLDLEAGQIHALVGSNGAGKSTLAKILCGLTPLTSGEIYLNGDRYQPKDKHAASHAGVIMVLQELNIIPTLTVAENLFLDRLPSAWGVIDRKRLNQQAVAALRTVRMEGTDTTTPAGNLGIGQQQMIEIAGALAQDCRVLILDEPTAALTDPEIEKLFLQMEALKKDGVGIIYISHRMDEIRRIADRVTVMRDGRRISSQSVAEIDMETIVNQMAGKEIVIQAARDRDLSTAPVALEVRSLRAKPLVRDVSLQLRKGEILGLAGLVGSGRTETLRAIFGADSMQSGEIQLGGGSIRIRSPEEAVGHGIGLIPEDRKRDGLLFDQSIRANASLANQENYARLGVIDRNREEKAIANGCARLNLKHDNLMQPVSELSGGNQQKVILVRWLLRNSEILLLDEPTRGIDVAAKETIYQLLRDLTEQGKSIIVVSGELPELMILCDRICVMSNGRITGDYTKENWSQDSITKAAFSGYLEGK